MTDEPENTRKAAPRRSAAKGSSRSGGAKSRRREAAPKSKGPAVAIAALVTVVAIVGVLFASGAFDGNKDTEADGGKQESAEKDETPEKSSTGSSKKASSVFDTEAGGDAAASNAPTRRTRVTGREPKSVPIEKLTKHFGHLYLDETLAKRIKDLETNVDEFRKQRWDISDELKKEFRSVGEEVSRARAHPFLSAADDDLKSFNDFTRKRELHLRDANDNLLPEPFIGVAHEPFVFMVQAHKAGGEKEIADEVYGWMVQLKAEFKRFFDGHLKLEPSKRHPRIKVVLFRTMKDYNNYNRIKNPERDITFALAHYEPDSRRLCVPLEFGASGGRDPKHTFREVMFHEGTHQVMHYFTNKTHLSAYGAMWSDEGVAEYFAGHSVGEEGKINFGRINSRIAAVARDTEMTRISMTDLLTWTRFKMQKARGEGPQKEREAQRIHSHVYSQGWALVYFLINYKNGIYKDKFMEVMKQQTESGDTGLPVWCRVFPSDAERTKIASEYTDYLDYLSKMHREKKIKNFELPG